VLEDDALVCVPVLVLAALEDPATRPAPPLEGPEAAPPLEEPEAAPPLKEPEAAPAVEV
jgi:hypothetical protein